MKTPSQQQPPAHRPRLHRRLLLLSQLLPLRLAFGRLPLQLVQLLAGGACLHLLLGGLALADGDVLQWEREARGGGR